MPDWRKLALFVVVGAAHLGVLTGFNVEGSRLSTEHQPTSAGLYVSLISPAVVDTAIATAPANTNIPMTLASSWQAAQAKPPENLNNTVSTPASLLAPISSVWGSRIKFFNADEVDKTAYLSDSFETALEHKLPLDVESIVLEFWIAKDGNTVQVICLEGACSDAVISSLGKLAELKFSPATKSDHAVASRKVIQIDPKPRAGL